MRYEVQLEEILIYDAAAGPRNVGDFVSFETYLHDVDGNMTTRTLNYPQPNEDETRYVWSDFDRLRHVESDQNGRMQDARYDASGLRDCKLDKNANSVNEYGVGISTATSAPASGSSSAPSISCIGGHMIMGAEIDGEFVYFLNDALSTMRDLVSYDQGTSQWKVLRSYEFDEYGNALPNSGNGTGPSSPKTFVGGLSVNDDTADSGLFNMGHRNYAAGVLGRFISRDPIGHAGNLNLYAYPNPVNFVDPWGLEGRLPTLRERSVMKRVLEQLAAKSSKIKVDYSDFESFQCIDVYQRTRVGAGLADNSVLSRTPGNPNRLVPSVKDMMVSADNSGTGNFWTPFSEVGSLDRAIKQMKPGQLVVFDFQHEDGSTTTAEHSGVVYSVKDGDAMLLMTTYFGWDPTSQSWVQEKPGVKFVSLKTYCNDITGGTAKVSGFGDLPVNK